MMVEVLDNGPDEISFKPADANARPTATAKQTPAGRWEVHNLDTGDIVLVAGRVQALGLGVAWVMK